VFDGVLGSRTRDGALPEEPPEPIVYPLDVPAVFEYMDIWFELSVNDEDP
jgi:hypothetical protein